MIGLAGRRVYQAIYGGHISLIFFTDGYRGDGSVWRFNTSAPNTPPELVRNTTFISRGIAVDTKHQRIFVALDFDDGTGTLASMTLNGDDFRDVVTADVGGFVIGLAVDTQKM